MDKEREVEVQDVVGSVGEREGDPAAVVLFHKLHLGTK